LSVLKLRGNHRFLNFSSHRVLWRYRSSEHLFQALKARSRRDHDYVRAARNAHVAKSRGREIKLRKDWEEIKLAAMVASLLLKFLAHPKLRKELMATHPVEIEEARGDPEWGIGRDGKGKNLMGQSLMIVRAIFNTSANLD
jgi:N-glycosidase YbiA